jgi:hypothetical protein
LSLAANFKDENKTDRSSNLCGVAVTDTGYKRDLLAIPNLYNIGNLSRSARLRVF